jgi:hypothetical protein
MDTRLFFSEPKEPYNKITTAIRGKSTRLVRYEDLVREDMEAMAFKKSA